MRIAAAFPSMKPDEILTRLPYAVGLQFYTLSLEKEGYKFEGEIEGSSFEEIAGVA